MKTSLKVNRSTLPNSLTGPETLIEKVNRLEAEAISTRQALARTRRQMRATWTCSVLVVVSILTLGAWPAARAQVGITLTSLDSRLKVVEAKTVALTDNATNKTLTVTGRNVQIVSGSGRTDDGTAETETPRGLGNLTIGYNELRGTGDVRTGSHNLIIGTQNNYSAYGGFVARSGCTIGGRDQNNHIVGIYASVAGGLSNTATGQFSTIAGGVSGTASGDGASIGGGSGNTASGLRSTVSGGAANTASAEESSVLAGAGNIASGFQASVSGGAVNLASGLQACVSGGDNNKAIFNSTSVNGGTGNTASGFRSTISGGANNRINTNGDAATISGGGGLVLDTGLGWVAGSRGSGTISGNFKSP